MECGGEGFEMGQAHVFEGGAGIGEKGGEVGDVVGIGLNGVAGIAALEFDVAYIAARRGLQDGGPGGCGVRVGIVLGVGGHCFLSLKPSRMPS